MKKIITILLAASMMLTTAVSVSAKPNKGWGNGNNNGWGNKKDEVTTLVNFYVQIHGEQMDTEGNVETQDTSFFTDIVATSELKEELETDFSIATGENVTEDDVLSYITEIPDDAEVLANVAKDFESKGYIKASNGEDISWDELNVDNYDVKWYVLKFESGYGFNEDSWHIDGVIIDLETNEEIVIIPDPIPEPTEEPEVTEEPVPTEEPTAVPTEEPATENDVPEYDDPEELSNDYAYIFGRNDYEMQPEDGMKRGEAAAVLYRLLKQNAKLGGFVYDINDKPIFDDTLGRWDRSALEYMSYIGVYGNSGWIHADTYINRGEAFKLMAIALGFTNNVALEEEAYALILKDAGYVEGDDEGNLDLDRNIKRAEYCKIYNMIIGRDDMSLETVDGEVITPETYGFVDIPENAWYYEIILKATSAYEGEYVDIEKRALRNVLDDYS